MRVSRCCRGLAAHGRLRIQTLAGHGDASAGSLSGRDRTAVASCTSGHYPDLREGRCPGIASVGTALAGRWAMKSLKQAAQDYIQMRRHLGFKMRHEERRLRRFVSFMEQEKSPYVTTKLALKWATQPAEAQHATWAERLRCVRVSARYCSGADPRTEVPPLGILPFHPQRATPYLYSQEEIRRLMEAARCLEPNGGLRGLTYHCLFGLLAVTG